MQMLTKLATKIKWICLMIVVWAAIAALMQLVLNQLPFGTQWPFSVWGCWSAVIIIFIIGAQDQ